MSTRVRIIKRDRAVGSQSLPVSEARTPQQNERDVASTVKNWIAELAQRRLADEHRARTHFFAAIG
ncbi:MAG TPA: hypothetical protein VFI24_03210 [Pyrinomonadaceae bacterium]|nr:hypothetical protein [Pyrinomonadaceae bacterium]